MPPKRKHPLQRGPSLYSYAAMTQEIEEWLSTQPRGTRKRLASAAGMTQPDFSHRMVEKDGKRFSEEEIGAIAYAAGAKRGWPWISWREANALAAFRDFAHSNDGDHEH